MCNLYSLTRSQEAMRRLFDVAHYLTGNLLPTPGISPDPPEPIVSRRRQAPAHAVGRVGGTAAGGAPSIVHWRRWLGPTSSAMCAAMAFLIAAGPSSSDLKPCSPGQESSEAVKDGRNLIIKPLCEETEPPRPPPKVDPRSVFDFGSTPF